MALVRIDDLSSVTEIAPSHAIAMDILLHAWLNAMIAVDDASYLANHIDRNVQSLVASFRDTDAVTLLEFLGQLLRQASSEVSTTTYKRHDMSYFIKHFFVTGHSSKSQVAQCSRQLYSKSRNQSTKLRSPVSLHKRCRFSSSRLSHCGFRINIQGGKNRRNAILLFIRQPSSNRHSFFSAPVTGATQQAGVFKSVPSTRICI